MDSTWSDKQWRDDYREFEYWAEGLYSVPSCVGPDVWQQRLTDDERDTLRALAKKLMPFEEKDPGHVSRHRAAVVADLTPAERASLAQFVRWAASETEQHIDFCRRLLKRLYSERDAFAEK